MPGAEERIRRLLRAGEAVTRPALARRAGVSTVMAGRIMARLVARGEAEETGRVPSGGGRPVMQYRVAANYGRLAHFRVERAGHVLRGGVVLTDMRGEPLQRSREMSFAMLQAESLDDWLDANARRGGGAPLRGITLSLPETLPPCGLEEHLHQRYGCPVRRINAALALAMLETRDDTLVLYLPRGGAPQGARRRRGGTTPCGQLHLLPTQVPWEDMDYADTTLVVETVSRLVMLLTCTLSPRRVALYADFWSPKLTSRIRYNCSAKLERCPTPPSLHFRPLPQEGMEAILARTAAR